MAEWDLIDPRPICRGVTFWHGMAMKIEVTYSDRD